MTDLRSDGRSPAELRSVSIETGVQEYAEGSALVAFGKTRVLCAASVETAVPRWLQGSGRGWVTAEYAMLPRATAERSARESAKGRVGGRTHEIQRLIGRSLRAVVDLPALGIHLVTVDCDVLQADGGTRTAAITGAWVALSLALDGMLERGLVAAPVPLAPLAAVSVGVVDGQVLLDLCYTEDSRAEVDMNVVMSGEDYVEVQGTAEAAPFTRHQHDALLDVAAAGCAQLVSVQRAAVERARPRPPVSAAP